MAGVLLSATLIVRDESRVLGECLASIRDVVDEIVVVDTGSVDDSVRIARGYGARVIHQQWRDDFAEARNVALDAAKGEWILYVDADERLSGANRERVERLLIGAPEVAFRVLLAPDLVSTRYLEYRLWQQDPRIRFRGQIHEKVTPAIAAVAHADGRPIGDCELLLTHVGYEGDQVRKHRRNLPLLCGELSREPDNLFNRHHLARILRDLGRDDEAALVLRNAVDVARRQSNDQLGVLVFSDLIRLRRQRGEDIGALLAEARALYPDNKLLWWVEATVRMSDGRHVDAIALLDRLLAVDLAALPAEGPAYDARIFGAFAHEARGTCLFRLGRYAEAADSYAEALRSDPGNLAYRSKCTVAQARARTAASGRVAPRPGPRATAAQSDVTFASPRQADAERLVVLTPIEPVPTGNGLAMRAELFRRSAPTHLDVQTVVVAVAGHVHGPRGTGSATVVSDSVRARGRARALAADPRWRDRLTHVGSLPPAARAASPGLADAVVRASCGTGPVALHVVRAYMAPLGAAVAERLEAVWATLDLDEDDAALARSAGDLEGAAGYERVLDVFGPLFDGLSAASADEAVAIGERHGLAVEHIPNAVRLAACSPRPPRIRSDEIPSLLFVGNLTYPPNVEAADLLVRVILPTVRRRLGRRVRVAVVGPHDGQLDRLRGAEVDVSGFVSDLGPVYASADAVVVPLRAGGGTRIKLLEAFAHGVPVVASSAAAAGLEVSDRRHLLLADDCDQAAAAIEAVLRDRELAARLVDEAARLVRERYSVDAVVPAIRDFFSRAADSARLRGRLSAF